MVCILLIGVATGVDLENRGARNPASNSPAAIQTICRPSYVLPPPIDNIGSINTFVAATGYITMVAFTAECILKIISQAYEPWRYFNDPDDGWFNCFDFFIVLAGFAFLGSENQGAIGVLRLLRLLRLLTFIKGVPQLRVIVSGLVSGLKSV